ncbi:phage tail protein, partial [Rhodanobacter lindaniclasticus]
MAFCVERRALLIVDPPGATWSSAGSITSANNAALTALGLNGVAARNAALYFPRVIESDPKRQGQLDTFVPCGIVAGVMARTDTQRGVWKAPAGIDAALNGVQGLAVPLNDAENGMLNPLGVNCLRSFPLVGPVAWGSRTLRGADLLADEYKYVPVRRLALYVESLYRGTQWVVFEPNDEPLWAQIRLNVGAFMQNLFRQGAFQGSTPNDAYFVKCDKETTTPEPDQPGHRQHRGRLRAAQARQIRGHPMQQMAGQIQTLRTYAMAQFSVNAQRFDPYKNFKFRVKWDGRYVAGVSKVSGLKRTTEVVKHREGGDPAARASRPGAPSTRRSPS